MGLDSNGFKRKTYDEILLDMEAKARSLFGDNVSLTSRTPLGMILRVSAWTMGTLWQALEKVFCSGFISTAEGVSLDYVIKNAGLIRKPAQKATGIVVFTGTGSIPTGTLLSTESGIQFETISKGSVSENIPVRAVVAGVSGNVGSSMVTTVVNIGALPNVTGVSNADPTTGGTNIESDTELRARYLQSFSLAGNGTKDAMRAKLLSLGGVRAVNVIDNVMDSVDVDGRPPHSVECYLLGGVSGDIAQSILDTKAAGIQTHGTQTETVLDDSGNENIIKFSYASEIPIYANITITKSEAYGLDGDRNVKIAILEYIGGSDDLGDFYTGLNMGQDVVYVKLIDRIMNVPGVEDLTLTISKDNITFNPSNIVISQNEVSQTDFTKLVISYA